MSRRTPGALIGPLEGLASARTHRAANRTAEPHWSPRATLAFSSASSLALWGAVILIGHTLLG
jgi:hypothetical protein